MSFVINVFKSKFGDSICSFIIDFGNTLNDSDSLITKYPEFSEITFKLSFDELYSVLPTPPEKLFKITESISL